jgi:hypothetical protein
LIAPSRRSARFIQIKPASSSNDATTISDFFNIGQSPLKTLRLGQQDNQTTR